MTRYHRIEDIPERLFKDGKTYQCYVDKETLPEELIETGRTMFVARSPITWIGITGFLATWRTLIYIVVVTASIVVISGQAMGFLTLSELKLEHEYPDGSRFYKNDIGKGLMIRPDGSIDWEVDTGIGQWMNQLIVLAVVIIIAILLFYYMRSR